MQQNLFRLCVGIEKDYQELFEQSLTRQGISQEGMRYIVDQFDFQKEMIFSLNKKYKGGQNLDVFCEKHHLSRQIPQCLDFHHGLYAHQEKAILSILNEQCTIISTGTGSGKTESFLIPILDYCLKNPSKGVKAVLIYPMNALAGDQTRRIHEALEGTAITYSIFNGDTPETDDLVHDKIANCYQSREAILRYLPDIIITNHVMLERVLTNTKYKHLFEQSSQSMKFIVLDEIHTFKGNTAADVSYLIQRLESLFENKCIKIACSATLSRSKKGEKQVGYIGGEIDNFIQGMFQLDSSDIYTYVEPEYEEIMLCEEAKKDPKVVWLAGQLYEGAMSFCEIQEGLKRIGYQYTKEELITYFEEIRQKAWLDFRVHFFMLQLRNTLKRCMTCGSYYTSHIQKCHKCAHLVLPVYKKNPAYLIGKIDNQHLVYPSEPLEKQEVLVLVGDYKEGEFEYTLRFDESYLTEEGFKIVPDVKGKRALVLDESLNKEGIHTGLIILEGKDQQDLIYESMMKFLMRLTSHQRKVLAFVDDREQCGRHSVNLGDRMLSDFFGMVMTWQIQQTPHYSIKELAQEVKRQLREQLISKQVLMEFSVWLRKWLRDVATYGMVIKPLYQGELTKREFEMIQVFIDEGAYRLTELKKAGEIIQVGWNKYSRPKVITYQSGAGNVLGRKNYQVIALTEAGKKYAHLMKDYSESQMAEAIASLKRKNIVIEDVEEGVYYYYLNVEAVGVNLITDVNNLTHLNLKELAEEYLCYAGAHNADVTKDKRKFNEEHFQAGDLQVLFSTPTLEMGIDIGSLHFVYMIGVPPAPSNYAQRTGRAGRRNDKFAGLIVLCDESKNHDWYYFQNPKEMIEGSIAPPKFDKDNNQVFNKHINTYLIRTPFDRLNHIDVQKKQVELEKVFKCSIDLQLHIQLTRRLQKHIKTNSDCYVSGFYPQYGFRRDEIKLFDHEGLQRSSREPEQAYKIFVPQERMYIGDKHHIIDEQQVQSNYFTHPTLEKAEVTCFESLVCTPNYAQSEKRERERKESVIFIERKEKQPFIDYVMLQAYKEKDLKISFVTQLFRHPSLSYIGYQRYRDSLILTFDKRVMDEGYYMSFISALDRTLKDELGFSEDEIGILYDEELASEVKEPEKYMVCFYDKGTVKNFDVDEIALKWHSEILPMVYRKVYNCQCKAEKGCYMCLRGQATQSIAHLIERKKLLVFLNHLLYNKKFNPIIHFKESIASYEVSLNLIQKGKIWTLEGSDGKVFSKEVDDNQNKTIFELLMEGLKYYYETDHLKTVKIYSKVSYLVNALNEESKIKKDLEAYRCYKFYTLVFDKVAVEGMD